MTHAESATPNPIQKGLAAMFLTWGRFITWTVLLSALLAIVFALAVDGCAR